MDRRPTSYDDLPLTLSVRELMPILSIGRNTAYELFHTEIIETVNGWRRRGPHGLPIIPLLSG